MGLEGSMEKQLTSKPGIVLQGNSLPLVKTEWDERADLVADYMEKFACIANRAITPQLLSIYVAALEDYDIGRIRKGMDEALKGVNAWPWPSDLINYIEEEI
jgi:hypothetical protein